MQKVDNMEDLATTKREAMQRLQILEEEAALTELTELCGVLGITIPTAKAGNAGKICSLIMRFMLDAEDEEDEGMKVFTDMTSHLRGKRPKESVKTEVKNETTEVQETAMVTDGGSGTGGGLKSSVPEVSRGVKAGKQGEGSSSTMGDVTSDLNNLSMDGATATALSAAVNLRKWRDFKITGGAVATGEKPLSYSSVRYQMNCGKKQGYTTEEVIRGVINAMHPSQVRQYLKNHDLTEKEFTDSLRSEYGITDYEALVDELDHAAQGRGEKVKATESVQDFMYRIGNLRNDIVTISREEGDPMEPSAVQKKFLKTLSVGLRDGSIRLQLLPVLKNDKITDQEIRCEIKKIVARNKEHEKRMEGRQ